MQEQGSYRAASGRLSVILLKGSRRKPQSDFHIAFDRDQVATNMPHAAGPPVDPTTAAR
jgi:hypothetical protein